MSVESMVSGHFHSCLGGLALELGSVDIQGPDSKVITVMSQRNSGSSSLLLSTSGKRTKASSHLGCRREHFSLGLHLTRLGIAAVA